PTFLCLRREKSREFLARTLRRRAGSAGVPWPRSEAPRLRFDDPKRVVILSERSESKDLSPCFLCPPLWSLFRFSHSALSPISLAGKRRPKLSCGQPCQRAKAPAEFAGGQTPLAVQPAEKILGPPLPLQRATFRTRRHQVAVTIAPSPDARHHVVDAPHGRPQPAQAVKAEPTLARAQRLAQR